MGTPPFAPKEAGLKIPFEQLSKDALWALVEEFVTRDGTDYGEIEVPVQTKIKRVLAQLESGSATIVFDQVSETCTILSTNHPGVKNL
ncbi:MAG: YheU family protein [Desulfobacter sp.]|nr:YheU family protein [Desulfobacter sp.]